MAFINMISAVYIILLQNPPLYLKQWKLVLLLGIPCAIGSVSGVLVLKHIANDAAALSYVKSGLAILFILMGMYFLTTMLAARITEYLHLRAEGKKGEIEGEEGQEGIEAESEEEREGHDEIENKRKMNGDVLASTEKGMERAMSFTDPCYEVEVGRKRANSNMTVTAITSTEDGQSETEEDVGGDEEEEEGGKKNKKATHVGHGSKSLPWLMDHSLPLTDHQFAAMLIPIALVAGVMGGLTSIKGPPFIILFGFAKVPPKSIPLFMIPVFTITSTSVFITAAVKGLFDWSLWPVYLAIVLGCVIGMAIGVFLRRHVEAGPLKIVLYTIGEERKKEK